MCRLKNLLVYYNFDFFLSRPIEDKKQVQAKIKTKAANEAPSQTKSPVQSIMQGNEKKEGWRANKE